LRAALIKTKQVLSAQEYRYIEYECWHILIIYYTELKMFTPTRSLISYFIVNY
jgi:hypothetical protein